MQIELLALEVLGFIFSLFIGISLGLAGSGGSILAVPILVYFFGVSSEVATTHSLFIVGITSVVASYKHHRAGNLKLKTALIFTVPSLTVLLLTRRFFLPTIPEVIFSNNHFTLPRHVLILIIFSVLMIASALSMIRKESTLETGQASILKIMLIGTLIGFLSGLLGAGGGFLIVPALLFYAGLELKYAIATSVFIITVNSLIGFLGDVMARVHFDKILLTKVSGMALIGMFIGIAISKKIDGKKLKPVFGWFVLVIAIFIIVKELFL
ncbi:MAG: sulfite exporter TauE/SafE family protein [Niabella sp.]